MGTALTGLEIKDTYDGLIKTTDNGALTSLKTLSDGLGNDSSLSLSATAASVAGSLAVSGNATFDTNTLFVDAANNRVGIGTATPAQTLDVTGTLAVSGAATLGSASVTGALDSASIETDAAETSTAAVWKLGNKGDGNVFVSALDYIIVQVAGLVIKLPLAIFPDTKDYYDRVIADSGTFEGMACYESSSTILKYN